MRTERKRPAGTSRPGSKLEFLLLDEDLFAQAWRDFLAENYGASLQGARRCLEMAQGGDLSPMALVPDVGTPTVRDGVVLCARNLFQLDRFTEFEVLQASAGRWGLVPEGSPELDVIQLAFACKQGNYLQVIRAATLFIDANRTSLPPVIADYLHLRGLAYSHLGDAGKARPDTEAAYSLYRVLGKDYEGARSANLMGIIQFRSSTYGLAREWFSRALDLHTRLGMRKNMGGNRLNLGIACYKQGDFNGAIAQFHVAAGLCDEVNARVSRCRADIALGNTLRLQRKSEEARRHLLKAYADANQLMLSREEALALEFLGDASRDEGRIDQARSFYSRALAIGRSIAPEGDIVMEVLRRQGQCLALLNRQPEAVTVLTRALGLARKQGDRYEEGVIRRVLAETLLEMGDLESAEAYALRSVDLLDGISAQHELAKSHLVGARVRLAQLDGGLCDEPGAVLDLAWQGAMASLDLFLRTDVEFWILAARRIVNLLSDRRSDLEQSTQAACTADPGFGMELQRPQPIIHVSARMRDLIQLCDAFADSPEPVLITGETGTGKEVFARRLHEKGDRRSGELVCVNATAIPRDIFAREFFGHVRGSFTGADQGGIGLAARADGGTLFLDEIGELPLELQPQLLRLLQDGTYQAIGDPAQRRTNIRLVAATNADLPRLVAEGKFRSDLFYRLKILELKLPPIAERREDILPLLRHFLGLAAGRAVKLAEYFNRQSLEEMQQYRWPGNVREIAMVARQARVQLASRSRVSIEVGLDQETRTVFTGPGSPECEGPVPIRTRDKGGRSRLLLALAETEGNRAEAARRLGVSRSTLYRRMEKLGIVS